jgi:hypothetical protein
LSLGSSAQQAKPNNPHVVVATLNISVTLNGAAVKGNQLVVWADPINDIDAIHTILATPDSGGWVIKQLPVGNYEVNAWAPGLTGFAKNTLNGWVEVTATTAPVQIEMKAQRTGSFWAHVLNAQGKPAAGVTVEFVSPKFGDPLRSERFTCVTFGVGLCYSPVSDFPPSKIIQGAWSVSIPGQPAKQVTIGPDLAPVAVEFKQN